MTGVWKTAGGARLFLAGVAALVLGSCDLIPFFGGGAHRNIINACQYATGGAYSGEACACFADALERRLSSENFYRFGELANRGALSDPENLRNSMSRADFLAIRTAARQCNLPLFRQDAQDAQDTHGGDDSQTPGGQYQPPGSQYQPPPGQSGRPGRRPGAPFRAVEFPEEPWAFRYYNDREQAVCLHGFGYEEHCLSPEAAARLYNDGARYWLLRGDAELATSDLNRLDPSAYAYLFPDGYGYPGRQDHSIRNAMRYWALSIDWGRAFGAQSALLAQRRLQAHMVQCESSTDSLARISRRGPGEIGDVIALELRQAALAALGYYAAYVDGQYGPATREAVRGFQRELGYDETGTLTPRQTTLLICHAAQTARDPHLQNALGIMYATGLGVMRNTDLSLEWFETAARRDDADAYFNLALIYGTGAVLGSYRLCGVVENPERADAYLRDSARLGHPVAASWRRHREFTQHADARSRWLAVSNRLEEAATRRGSDFYLEWRSQIDLDRLQATPPACLEAEGGRADGRH